MTPSLDNNEISKKQSSIIRGFCFVLYKALRKSSLFRGWGGAKNILYLGGGLLKKGTLKVKRFKEGVEVKGRDSAFASKSSQEPVRTTKIHTNVVEHMINKKSKTVFQNSCQFLMKSS